MGNFTMPVAGKCLMAGTFTEYNAGHRLMNQDDYDAEVEDMRSYIEEKMAEVCY